MSEINKEKMLKISDEVIKDYLKKFDNLEEKNPYIESLINHISDIASLVVLEYHKKVHENKE